MGDALFNIDVVRDFMISKSNRVRNHELVTHFKGFLNDPTHKDSNRLKFKDFVNTLASIKLDETGEKVLVLKKKWRDVSPTDAQSSTNNNEAYPKDGATNAPKVARLPGFKQEPEKPDTSEISSDGNSSSAKPLLSSTILSQTNSSDHSLESGLSSSYVTADSTVSVSSSVAVVRANQTESPVPPVRSKHRPGSGGVSNGHDVTQTSVSTEDISQSSASHSAVSSMNTTENSDVAMDDSQLVSVKDRAKHLNKMTSESDVQRLLKNTAKRKPRGGRTDDTASLNNAPIALEPMEREFLVTAAKAEYQEIHKILLSNPHLARRKDIACGYTPLHWAAKAGQCDIIKLLCGTGEVDVNTRSGYTPLHLAAMQGHEDAIELLIHGYGADANLRDYSGKKAKQYLQHSASSRTQRGRFQRVGSYSSKIQKAGFFGITGPVSMRASWGQPSERAGSEHGGSRNSSPARDERRFTSLPPPSHLDLDAAVMPPPMHAPPRRKRSTKRGDCVSNSNPELHVIEHNFPLTAGSMV